MARPQAIISDGASLPRICGFTLLLTDMLAKGLAIRTSTPVTNLDRKGDRFQLEISGGTHEEADRVILAAPAHVQAQILQDMAPDIALLLNGISYPPLSVVCLGYRKQDLGQYLDGFGWRPLSTEWDYPATLERVRKEVFPDEFRRLESAR